MATIGLKTESVRGTVRCQLVLRLVFIDFDLVTGWIQLISGFPAFIALPTTAVRPK